MVIGSLNSRVSHFFTMPTNIVTKGLFAWRWGTPSGCGNQLRWGNLPVYMISHFLSCLLDRWGDHTRDYIMDTYATSPAWGPLPPCKQALRLLNSLKKSHMMGHFTVFSTVAVTIQVCANCPVGRENIKETFRF